MVWLLPFGSSVRLRSRQDRRRAYNIHQESGDLQMASGLKYLLGGAMLTAALAASGTASAQDVIKIGIPVGLSGANSVKSEKE